MPSLYTIEEPNSFSEDGSTSFRVVLNNGTPPIGPVYVTITLSEGYGIYHGIR